MPLKCKKCGCCHTAKTPCITEPKERRRLGYPVRDTARPMGFTKDTDSLTPGCVVRP